MALNISNLKQLQKFQSSLVPCEYADEQKNAKAELHMYSDSENLPRLHLAWKEVHCVTLKTEAEVAEAKKMGYAPKENTYRLDGEKSWDVFAMEKHHRHLWLCNFRRYGWSFTDQAAGEEYYAHGVTYANGPAIYHLNRTPEETVRDALVHTWAEQLGRELIPRFFDVPEVHACLDALLEDAFNHLTGHSAVRPVPTGHESIKVTVVKENPNSKERRAAELQAEKAALAAKLESVESQLKQL
jgi:hypothetical protein